jgi:hypothetical protein
MARFVSTIRPAPGADGPYYVVTESAGSGAVANVTTGVASLAAALDQAKSDQAALLAGLTVQRVVIGTEAE